MTKMQASLKEGLPLLGLNLSSKTQKKLCDFGQAVINQNQFMNLTAITEPAQVAKLHLLDSLSLLTIMDFHNKSVIDIGCGAGFPGVPIKIACPKINLTLLDSLEKRISWLSQTLPQLGIFNINYITARAEDAVQNYREQYDIATSRAVARLNILLELTAPYVKIGGYILAMKGISAEEELKEARNAISKLGLALEYTKNFFLNDMTHTVIVLRKVSSTPVNYPRRYAKIKQSPL